MAVVSIGVASDTFLMSFEVKSDKIRPNLDARKVTRVLTEFVYTDSVDIDVVLRLDDEIVTKYVQPLADVDYVKHEFRTKIETELRKLKDV